MQIIKKINELKKEKNIVLLGHYYLREEVQEIVDYIGDSYGLAREAMNTEADSIVFAGVKFMAETAKILNPDKKVYLGNRDSGCPLADMVTGKDVEEMRKKYKNLYVVCYVNSSAEVKAESDVCVTSRNAAPIVESIPDKYENILFVPDKNLGNYVQKVTGRKLIIWPGYCCVHENLEPEILDLIRKKEKESCILVHPECRPEVLQKADGIMSTSSMVKYCEKNPDKKVFSGTETGVIRSMKKFNKNVQPVSNDMICRNMKKITLQNISDCMEKGYNEIVLDENIMKKAYYPIKKMVEITESLNL
ncbi:MAG: quinolinate synthase NadA [Candidatus Muiribacteriota bacterium]